MQPAQPVSGNLVLEDVTKIFTNGVRAVEAVSLDIHGGEFMTLLGLSGCGKTTILRLIAGLELPTRGRILLDGQDLGLVPPNQRPMALVFQNYALFPHLNVFDNIAFGLRLQKLRPAEVRETVEMFLHMLNLAELEKRYPHQLAGGQQQRVALARAMVVKPRLLLFDEPLSSVDASLRDKMRKDIRRLQRQLGITSVYVTHDQAEAMYLSDRVAVMYKGRLEQVGTPEEVYLRPASIIVADSIGRANFIETQVLRRENAHATVMLLDKPINLPCHPGIQVGETAYAVVRTEAVQLAAGPVGVSGRVNSAVFLGSSVEYEVEIGSQLLTARDYTPRPEPIFSAGSLVRVELDTSRSYLLPARAGQKPGALVAAASAEADHAPEPV